MTHKLLSQLVVIALLSACAITKNEKNETINDITPQDITNSVPVNIAFDGSYSLSMWEDTLQVAKNNDVKFTYFIVGTHLLTNENRYLYINHRNQSGRSDVGFGGTKDEVEKRLLLIYQAFKDGHEIGSHANGHYNGAEFTKENWESELKQFDNFLRNAWEINQIENNKPDDWDVIADNIIGFRAPLLAMNEVGYETLVELGYKYDTSFAKSIGTYFTEPYPGIIGLPLHSIEYKEKSKVLSMDYNFYYKDKKNNPEAYETMANSYKKYAEFSVLNNTPISIGHHFSLWNNGQYWNALKDFIKSYCNLEQYQCITKRKTLDTYLSKNDKNL